jgi:FkbM family methyltransferase
LPLRPDFGSNTGLYAFVADKNKNVIQAYAIEPNPHLVPVLQRNKSLNNSRIEILDVGIGDANRSAGLEFNPSHSGKGKVGQNVGSSTMIKLSNYELFDEIASNHPDCRFFCKIDVEGMEAVVVEQIARSRIRDRLIGATVEIDNRRHSEEEKESIRQTLTNCGLLETGRFGDEGHYDMYFTQC